MKSIFFFSLLLVLSGVFMLPAGYARQNLQKHQPSHPANDSCWEYVGTPGFSGGAASSICSALDNNGNLYVAFVDHQYLSHASVMKYDGSSWSYVASPGFTNGPVDFLSLSITYSDTLYIAFEDGSNTWKASVMK